MGAPMSAEFTVHYPEKVNKVVLIDPVHEPVDIFIISKLKKIPLVCEYIMNVFIAPTLVKDPLDNFYQQQAFRE